MPSRKASEDNLEQPSSFPPLWRRRKEKLLCPLPWVTGGIGDKTWRPQQKVPKTSCFWALLINGVPNLGLLFTGAWIKTRSVASPKTGLKCGRKSRCCFSSGHAGEEAHDAFELDKNTGNCFWQTIWIKLMNLHKRICCWLRLRFHLFHVTYFNAYVCKACSLDA